MFKKQTSGERHHSNIISSKIVQSRKKMSSKKKQILGYYVIIYPGIQNHKPRVVVHRSYQPYFDKTMSKKCDRKCGVIAEYISSKKLSSNVTFDLQQVIQSWIHFLMLHSYSDINDIRQHK